MFASDRSGTVRPAWTQDRALARTPRDRRQL